MRPGVPAFAKLAQDMAREEGIETVWDRLAAQQPQCGYCAMGVSCRNCSMGPCRVDPFGEGPQKGVCGADADVIVARNLGRTIAAGASAHPGIDAAATDVVYDQQGVYSFPGGNTGNQMGGWFSK